MFVSKVEAPQSKMPRVVDCPENESDGIFGIIGSAPCPKSELMLTSTGSGNNIAGHTVTEKVLIPSVY